MGEGQTVTMGIISAVNLRITVDDPGMRQRLTLEVLQTDAAVNRGNSGGPLVNQHGEVIGMVTAKLFGTGIEGMGYVMPINNVRDILLDIQETGSVRQPYMGITHSDISEFWRELFNLEATGVLVSSVISGSPAEEAGIRPRDLIVSYNGEIIAGREDFVNAINASRAGDEITLGIIRDGINIEVKVVLGSLMQ
jgi:serine protease Do